MTSYDLLLTLGHNSSAILVGVRDGQGHIVCGYEEERLTQKKSDSQFPTRAIQECLRQRGLTKVNRVYVTHWAIDGHIDSMSAKHWNPALLPDYCNLVTHHSTGMTHHDTHARSAAWYANSKPGLKIEDTMVFVIDGFGNMGEHISIYQMGGYGPKLIRRFFGYDGSLGLMYQYMTAFLGMKMHEDEYKLLGYEAHINEVDVDLLLLHELINKEITRYLDGYFGKSLVSHNDPLLKLDALPGFQKDLIERWIKVAKYLGLEYDQNSCLIQPTFHNRVIMSYYAQSVLEGVVMTLLKVYRPKNVIASGGVFYNVKLNRRILDVIPGKLCVFPLAGDQGNALGLYANENDLVWPGHLNWGIRPKHGLKWIGPHNGFHVYPDRNKEAAVEVMLNALTDDYLVNIVKGAMEFGPRALCNTSTIARAHPSVVNRINRMNGRNTIMPMAPVMNRMTYKAGMQLTDKIHLSEEHMIVALPYKPGSYGDILGAVHQYDNEVTGRPQVLDNDFIINRLFRVGDVLINTSFNIHGVPIVLTAEQALHCHEFQRKTESVTTVYLEDGK